MRALLLAAVAGSPSLFGQVNGSGDLSLDSLLNITITTASKHREAAGDAPASVSIITSQDIARFGFTTLDEMVASVRGFYSTYDRNYAYVGVRGFSRPTDYNNRILLLVNGHTLNEGFYGSAPFGTDCALDVDAIDRVEIIRGPGTVLYGSGAMFAVVNVITRNGAAFDKVRLSAGGGSFGRMRGTLLAGKDLGSDAEALVSLHWDDAKGRDLYFREYDADSTNHGIARAMDWDRSVGLYASLRVGALSFQTMYSSRKKGIPTGAYGVAFNDARASSLDQYGLLDARWNPRLAEDKHLFVRGYVDLYRYEGSWPYAVMAWDRTRATRAGGEAQLQWDVLPGSRLTLGAEYLSAIHADYGNWDADTTYADGNFPYHTFSLYAQDEIQITDEVALTLGLRRDQYSTFGSAFTPRGGLVLHPTGSTTLKLLYGEAFRAPNVYEVNYLDPTTGFKRSEGLGPERIRTLEVVVEQRLASGLFGTLSLYGTRMKGLIDQAIDPADSLLHFQNLQDVDAEGIEGELTAQLTDGTRGFLSYTFQRSMLRGTTQELTNVPTHMVKVGISLSPAPWARIGAYGEYESSRITVQETRTDPFVTLNLNAEISPVQLTGLRCSFLVRNVFNEPIKTPGGFEHRQPALLQDGRSFFVTLGLTL